MRAEAEAELATQGLVAALTAKLSRAAADELEARARVEGERLRLVTGSVDAQIAVARATVDQRRGMADLRRSQLDAQRVAPGTNLARVVQPARLKAVVRIPETLAKDVGIGLTAVIDTRGSTVRGRVARIDPAAQGGTVAVDITFGGAALPVGARPDLTVDGTIEIERLQGVLHVGRPAQATEQATLALFRVGPDGYALRTSVQLGRASVNRVEVRSGLAEGDRVVLSDTSAWDGVDRVRLQ